MNTHNGPSDYDTEDSDSESPGPESAWQVSLALGLELSIILYLLAGNARARLQLQPESWCLRTARPLTVTSGSGPPAAVAWQAAGPRAAADR